LNSATESGVEWQCADARSQPQGNHAKRIDSLVMRRFLELISERAECCADPLVRIVITEVLLDLSGTTEPIFSIGPKTWKPGVHLLSTLWS